MKKLFLFLLISLVSLQPLFAATADFAHVLSSQSTEEKTFKHMEEHFEHVAHHHDDEGDAHEDESQKSIGHMMDFEHGLNLSSIPAAESKLVLSKLESVAPVYLPNIYFNPSHSPPLKPPFQAL